MKRCLLTFLILVLGFSQAFAGFYNKAGLSFSYPDFFLLIDDSHKLSDPRSRFVVLNIDAYSEINILRLYNPGISLAKFEQISINRLKAAYIPADLSVIQMVLKSQATFLGRYVTGPNYIYSIFYPNLTITGSFFYFAFPTEKSYFLITVNARGKRNLDSVLQALKLLERTLRLEE